MAVDSVGTANEHDGADLTLVRLAKTCPSAFEPIYLRYRDRIVSYCARRLDDRNDAEDAASAIFVAALRGLPDFCDDESSTDSFRSWLFTIAHNEVAMRWRRRSRHPEQSLDGATKSLTNAQSPEDHAILADGQRRLVVAMRDLPQREREVLELRIADLQTEEIATILGISTQNVRTVQSRAIARLRIALQRVNSLVAEAMHG